MKRRKIAPLSTTPTRPAAPAATRKLLEVTAPGSNIRPVEPPGPHQATTEEAVEVWRNEGDPN